MREIKSPRLAFISAGPRPANPADLVGITTHARGARELRGHYDFIVLDSPPVLPVTDAVLLSRTADSVLLVMKGQQAPREQVRRARDQLVLLGARVAGVVVNNAGSDWGNYHYDYNRIRTISAHERQTLRRRPSAAQGGMSAAGEATGAQGQSLLRVIVSLLRASPSAVVRGRQDRERPPGAGVIGHSSNGLDLSARPCRRTAAKLCGGGDEDQGTARRRGATELHEDRADLLGVRAQRSARSTWRSCTPASTTIPACRTTSSVIWSCPEPSVNLGSAPARTPNRRPR